jgi:hypothetical protein
VIPRACSELLVRQMLLMLDDASTVAAAMKRLQQPPMDGMTEDPPLCCCSVADARNATPGDDRVRTHPRRRRSPPCWCLQREGVQQACCSSAGRASRPNNFGAFLASIDKDGQADTDDDYTRGVQ